MARKRGWCFLGGLILRCTLWQLWACFNDSPKWLNIYIKTAHNIHNMETLPENKRKNVVKKIKRWNFFSLLVTHSFFTRYSLLFTRYSLLLIHCSLLFTRHLLLSIRYSLVFTRYSLLFTVYLLIFTRCLLIFTRY